MVFHLKKQITPNKLVILLLLTTSIIKILYILKYGSIYNLNSDDRDYLRTAYTLIHSGILAYGNNFDKPTVFIMPLYPLFISLIMRITGPGYLLEQTVRIAQIIIVSGSFYVLFLIGKRVFNEKVALFAVLISSIYLPLWLISFFILTEALFVLGIMFLIYFSIRAIETPNIKLTLFFTLSWAFTTLIRPTITLWPGIFFIILLWKNNNLKTILKYALVGIVIFVLCMSPWWIRNYKVTNNFIPLTKSSGNPLLLGTFITTPPQIEIQKKWYVYHDLWYDDDYQYKMAIERIKNGFKNEPLKYLSWYTYGKFKQFWVAPYYCIPIVVSYMTVLRFNLLILFFGLIGIMFNIKKKPCLVIISLIAYLNILHNIYFVSARYSVPLMPLIILFAVNSIHIIYKMVSQSILKIKSLQG